MKILLISNTTNYVLWSITGVMLVLGISIIVWAFTAAEGHEFEKDPFENW